MSVLLYPTCPEDCAVSLPEPSFSECNTTWGYGEINRLYVGKIGTAPFSNVEDLSEWTTRLGLTISDDDAIRAFTVKGQLAAPAVTEIQASDNRTIRGFKKFTLAAIIDEDTDENYQAHLTFECNNKYVIWFGTADGVLFGGTEGIESSIVTDYIIPPDRTALRYIDLKAIWDSKKSPLRSINPNA